MSDSDSANRPPFIHYAPHGPNAAGQFDCGAKFGDGGYMVHPSGVTCEGCKAKSPGLWPPQVSSRLPLQEAASTSRNEIILKNPTDSGKTMTVVEGDLEVAFMPPGAWLRVGHECCWMEMPVRTPAQEFAKFTDEMIGPVISLPSLTITDCQGRVVLSPEVLELLEAAESLMMGQGSGCSDAAERLRTAAVALRCFIDMNPTT